MRRGERTSQQSLAGVVIALVLGTVPLSTNAGAQVAGSGSIVGQVTDESKAVLPGVTVTATSPALQVPQVVAVTDERGEYRLTPLPIGTYNVEYGLQGFQTVRREGVRLSAGFTAKVDIVLAVGQLEETVTVSGAPVVDVSATSITTHVSQEVLENIPTGKNGYTALLELAPGARGNIDVGGSTNNSTPSFSNFGMQEESWQSVEGVSTKTPNISDSGNFPDFSTIEQAAIESMGHDASVPSRGVAINTVIKSGGNDYHGTALYGGTNDALESNPASGGSLKYFPHAGGFFAFVTPRMDYSMGTAEYYNRGRTNSFKTLKQPRASDYRRRFHCDLIMHDPKITRMLIELVGADRVVCGTDYPQGMGIVNPVAYVEAIPGITQKEAETILCDGPARLLRLQG